MEGQGILYFATAICAKSPGEAMLFCSGWGGSAAVLTPISAVRTGVFFPHVPKDPDLCRDDVELLGHLLFDLDEPLAIVGADPLFRRAVGITSIRGSASGSGFRPGRTR